MTDRTEQERSWLTQRHWQENSHQHNQQHLTGVAEEPGAPPCNQTFAVLQEHPSRQNSVAPVRAQQGSRAAAQQAEHGGLFAEQMPCDHQQRTECSWHQGYLFVSECYALVGASCSRSCPSTRISRVYRRKPAPLLLHKNFSQFFSWREIFVLTVPVILY